MVSQPLLGLKPELSNHINKPLVWLFWAIIPLLFNDWFMGKFPFYTSRDQSSKVSTSGASKGQSS
jgi:amino acid transporter, AAT family